MKQKELIEKATTAFLECFNSEVLITRMESKREYLAPWVTDVLDKELPSKVKISTIIYGLFDDCVCEVGENFARKDTGKFDEDFGDTDAFGGILEVTETSGHVWIRAEISDSPFGHIEISLMDNDR